MQRWADFFFASVRQQLVPFPEDRRIRSGAGWQRPRRRQDVGLGPSSAVLGDLEQYSTGPGLEPTYNYSLLVHNSIEPERRDRIFRISCMFIYHFMLHEILCRRIRC